MNSPLPLSETSFAKLIALLRGGMLFREASDEALQEIATLVRQMDYRAGDPVFLEDELSRHVYFVLSGKAEEVRYDHHLKQLTRIRTLSLGEHFSELSVLAGSNHFTSCFALEPLTLLKLDYQVFFGILHSWPEIAASLVRQLARINHQLTSSQNYLEYFKEDLVKITPELVRLFPLELVAQLEAIPVRLDERTLTLAAIDPYNRQLIDVLRRMNTTLKFRLNVINKQDFKRIYGQVVVHYQSTGRSMPPPLNPKGREDGGSDLEKRIRFTSVLSRLAKKELERLLPLFESRVVKPGEMINPPGKTGGSLFLIKSGEIVLKQPNAKPGAAKEVSLQANEFLGEFALLTGSAFSISAVAGKETELYVLKHESFIPLLEDSEFCLALCRSLADRLQDTQRTVRIRVYPNRILGPLPLNVLPRSVILDNKIVPISLSGNELTLGVVNPEEGLITSIISRYLADYRLNVYAVSEAEYTRAIEQFVAPPTGQVVAGGEPKARALPTHNAAQFVEQLLVEAYKMRASDVHVEPLKQNVAIRYRIDGELRELNDRLDREFGSAVVNRIKVSCNMDIAEKRIPQDGQLTIKQNEIELSARVSCVPTKLGEKMVLRLVKAHEAATPLNMLVPDRGTVGFLKQITRHNQGVFLLTGPTGSGKTTSLYSLLNELNTININIVTVEDPVELVIPGITQINIHDKIGLSFEQVLRFILRQDPDVIMIGEVRDAQSAQFTFEAAMTGHLVFSTLHTNHSLDIVPRLRELGVSNSSLMSGLVGTMAQRLVGSICSSCKTMRPTTVEEIEVFTTRVKGITPPRKVAYGAGCEHCHGTGYKGRLPVCEYWAATPETREVMHRNGSPEEFHKAVVAQGFRSLYTFGLQMVLNGLTTIEQLDKQLFGLEVAAAPEKKAA